MKASEWEFKGYIPDIEDIEALNKIRKIFFDSIVKNPWLNKCNEAERKISIFDSGFWRGIDWAKNKNKTDGSYIS